MTAIQIDETTHDLKVSGGTLSIGETSEQNQYLILAAHKGEFKNHPTLGVGIGDYTNDDNGAAELKHNIRDSFRQDGLHIETLEISNNKLKIEAYYDRI